MVAVLAGRDEEHGAAAGLRGHAVREERGLGHEHAGGARSADELVRREEDGVLVAVAAVAGRVHVDGDVGSRRGEVPERERAVAVQERRDGDGVRGDAGDVGRRGEAADAQRAVRVGDELALEVREVDVAVGVGVDGDHVGDGLAPRELVGVVLEGPDEHHGPLVGGDLRAEAVARVEVRGEPEVQHVD